MRRSIFLLVLGQALAGFFAALAQPVAYVGNHRSNTVSLVDTGSNTVKIGRAHV